MDSRTKPPLASAGGRTIRDKIVASAADLVVTSGVAGTSMDAVRRAAGVADKQLTEHFPDKKSLLHAVIGYRSDNMVAKQKHLALEGQQSTGLDGLAALRNWAEFHIAEQARNDGRRGCPLGALVGELGKSDAAARLDLAAAFHQWTALLEDGLTVMRDRGELRPDANPADLATGLLAALQGGILLARTRRDVALLRTALESMLEQVRSFAADGQANQGSECA